MGLPWRRCSGQGPHPVKTLEHVVFLELRLDSRKRRGFQASSWVGPGKPNLPLELRGNPCVESSLVLLEEDVSYDQVLYYTQIPKDKFQNIMEKNIRFSYRKQEYILL